MLQYSRIILLAIYYFPWCGNDGSALRFAHMKPPAVGRLVSQSLYPTDPQGISPAAQWPDYSRAGHRVSRL